MVMFKFRHGHKMDILKHPNRFNGCRTMGKQESFVGLRVPLNLKELIVKFIKADTHMNESDFVRDAIRQKIKHDAPHLYAELFIQKEETSQK